MFITHSVPETAGRGARRTVQDEFKKYREVAPPTLSDDALTELIRTKKYANSISRSLQEMWHGMKANSSIILLNH